MSVSVPVEITKPASLLHPVRKVAAFGLAVTVFTLVVAFVTFVRTFAFEYFHGDPAALQGLVRAILGS
jgi:hypothetical protein